MIRPERPDDRGQIATVVRAAFGSPAEAQLVDAIRASDGFVPDLSLVAERDEQVVGHVMISIATLRDGTRSRPVAMLSPLAVTPDLHGGGIGSALVRAATDRAEELGEPMVVLEGSPVFYGRLGFEPSAPLGIHLPLPSWAPPEAAQLMRLATYDPSMTGTVVYPPAFDGVTEP